MQGMAPWFPEHAASSVRSKFTFIPGKSTAKTRSNGRLAVPSARSMPANGPA